MSEYLITGGASYIVNPVSSKLLQGHQFCAVDLERQIELEKSRLYRDFFHCGNISDINLFHGIFFGNFLNLYSLLSLFWMANTDLNEGIESILPSLFEGLL